MLFLWRRCLPPLTFAHKGGVFCLSFDNPGSTYPQVPNSREPEGWNGDYNGHKFHILGNKGDRLCVPRSKSIIFDFDSGHQSSLIQKLNTFQGSSPLCGSFIVGKLLDGKMIAVHSGINQPWWILAEEWPERCLQNSVNRTWRKSEAGIGLLASPR